MCKIFDGIQYKSQILNLIVHKDLGNLVLKYLWAKF